MSRHAARAAATLVIIFLVLAGGLVGIGAASKGPPPTPVPPDGSPSPFPQQLDTPANDRVPPKLRAKAALLADLETGQVLLERRPTLRRPIASVTKIMTALVVLEETKPQEKVRVSSEATRTSGIPGLSTLPLRTGEQRAVHELLDGLLIQSANDAAVALAEHVDGSVPRFVAHMNKRAKELGMRDTRFASPNGLNDAGYSSAADLLVLTQAAMAEPEFRRVVAQRFASVPGAQPSDPARKIQNRNVLLWLYKGADGVKTGFTSRAGYCIVATATRDGRTLVAVLLGNPVATFDDAAALLNYGFDGFQTQTLADEGEVVATRTIDGQKVELEAGTELAALVPRKGKVDLRPILAKDAAAIAGERVGMLEARAGNLVLGEAPLVVAASAAAQPAEIPHDLAGLLADLDAEQRATLEEGVRNALAAAHGMAQV